MRKVWGRSMNAGREGRKEVVRRFWVANKEVLEKEGKEGRKLMMKREALNMTWKMYVNLFSKLF
jgi:hypothetical protein